MKRLVYILAIASFVFSCTTDAYEKGEGKYSLMRGDFVEAKVNADRQIVSFCTDDGEEYDLTEPYAGKWIETPDTLYRCMLYYNKVESQKAELVSIGEVPCPRIKTMAEFEKDIRMDPVKFESIWLSKSGKYLNLYLQLKTGVTEDTSAVQQLAFLTDTIIAHPNGTRTHHILLHHDQNRVPEYYSTKAYVSIPIGFFDADSVHVSINTYNGPLVKVLSLNQ